MSVRLLSVAGCLLTFLPLSWSVCSAEEQNRALILQLGHADFDQRMAAERAILEQGPRGIETAREGLTSSDAEVRQRSQRLLIVLRKLNYRESRDELLNSPWTAAASVAPAWELFQSLAGDGPEARRMYVELIDAEPDLMLMMASQSKTWPAGFERRCAALKTFSDPRPNREASNLSVAALLLLAVHPDNRPSQDAANLIAALVVTSAFNRAAQDEKRGELYRGLVNRWIERSETTITPHQRLALAKSFDLPGGVPAAREILNNRHGPGRSRMQLHDAIRYLSRHGGPDSAPDLQAFLDDDGAPDCRLHATALLPHQTATDPTSPRNDDTYARDAALLGLLQLTGQNLEEYGVQNAQTNVDLRYGSSGPSFISDSHRAAAYEKWSVWRMRNLKTRLDIPRQASCGTAL